MPADIVTRRAALTRLLGGAAVVSLPFVPGAVWAASATGKTIGGAALGIEYDGAMRSRLLRGGVALTGFVPAEALRPVGAAPIERFTLIEAREESMTGVHGAGRRHRLRGVAQGVERRQTVTFLDAYPGVALIEITYRNTGAAPLAIAGWRAATHDLPTGGEGAWTFAGASYPNRRDWVQPVKPGFEQRNFMGMNGSDYGGGTPMAVVWRRDAGIAVSPVLRAVARVSGD